MAPTSFSKAKINWQQAAGEALLIVLGVLLAMGGQAWWEARVERDVVNEYVDNLLLELNENEAGLRQLVENHGRYVTAATALLAEMRGDRSEVANAAIRDRISTLSFFSDFRPATSALENLIGNGGLGLLDNSEWRLAILKYAQSVDDHNVLQAEQTEFFLQSFIPYLSKSVPLLELHYINNVSGLPTESVYDFDTATLVESMEFENLIVRRISAEADAIEFANRLLEVIGRLQELLQISK